MITYKSMARSPRAVLGAVAAIALAITSGATTVSADTFQPRVVTHDNGGSVLQRFQQIAQLRVNRTPVQVVGQCDSACTMYLGLPNACVSPNASLGFHGPSLRGSNTALANSPEARLMAAHYPAQVRNWFMNHAQYLGANEVARLSGRQLIAMGVRQC